jgi:hypothetical protein
MKKLFICLALTGLHSYSFEQDSTGLWSKNKILGEVRKKINALNFQSNGMKTEHFDNSLCAEIYALKGVSDDNYLRFYKISDSNGMFKQSLIVAYRILNQKEIVTVQIGEIIEDFSLKAESIDLGLDNNEIQDIPVVVMTYDSNLKAISGYYVCWNSWLDKDNPLPFSKFDGFTSPTSSGNLIAGTYDIWVQKTGDNKRFPSLAERAKSDISLHGTQKIVTIKIIVKQ